MLGWLLNSGQEALANERYGEAERQFTAALRIDWNNPRAFDLLQTTRVRRVRACAEWEDRAKRAEGTQDWGTAIACWQRLAADDTARAEIRSHLEILTHRRDAWEFVRRGLEKFINEEYATAQADFEQALTIDPGDTLVAQFRARAMQKTASGTLADLQSDPTTWTKYLSALQKFRVGDLPAAEKLWNEILTKYPGNESVRSNLEQVRKRLHQDGVAAAE